MKTHIRLFFSLIGVLLFSHLNGTHKIIIEKVGKPYDCSGKAIPITMESETTGMYSQWMSPQFNNVGGMQSLKQSYTSLYDLDKNFQGKFISRYLIPNVFNPNFNRYFPIPSAKVMVSMATLADRKNYVVEIVKDKKIYSKQYPLNDFSQGWPVGIKSFMDTDVKGAPTVKKYKTDLGLNGPFIIHWVVKSPEKDQTKPEGDKDIFYYGLYYGQAPAHYDNRGGGSAGSGLVTDKLADYIFKENYSWDWPWPISSK